MLDDVYNPGLREAIKEYSAWPTIPQVGCCWGRRGRKMGHAVHCGWLHARPPATAHTHHVAHPRFAAAQVYVGGEFVGGADIVESMYNSGERSCCFSGLGIERVPAGPPQDVQHQRGGRLSGLPDDVSLSRL